MYLVCNKCDSTGINYDVEDGFCTCWYGMELRKIHNPAYRRIKAPPAPEKEPYPGYHVWGTGWRKAKLTCIDKVMLL
jgi:hypothetical protein